MTSTDTPSAENFKRRIETIADNWQPTLVGDAYATSPEKRRFDTLVRLALAPIVVPLSFMAETAVILEDRGVAVIGLERTGLGAETFEQLKIRSMSTEAQHMSCRPEKEADDPRVTKVGKFLRRTSLDELKQFVNVRRGEMSIVGPRPTPVNFLEIFRESDPELYAQWEPRKHTMRPGITGPMQINGRGELGKSARGRATWMELEIAYAEAQCVQVDASILLNTIVKVARAENAY